MTPENFYIKKRFREGVEGAILPFGSEPVK
jgi:hypothetical protein